MNENEEDRLIRHRFGRVLEALKGLADAIERQRYPGTAWTGPERRVRPEATRRALFYRIAWPVAAGAAAAAAIAIGVSLFRPGEPPGTPPQQVGSVEQVSARFAASDIDLSLAGMLAMELPELALWPAEEEAGGPEWTAPAGTAPAPEEYRQPRRNASEPPES